jgi:5-methyltetrahydrofolate--homocysteine methyltransferase
MIRGPESVSPEDNTMVDFAKICDDLYKGKAKEVRQATEQALAEGVSPTDVLEKGLIAGMDRVGKDFKANQIYVPEVLIAARAMKSAMEVLRPALIAAGAEPVGTVIIGTAKGDLHDIGKNLVAMMMEGAGFKVVDLGVDVSPETFVQKAKEEKATVVGISALLTTTMVNMKGIIEALKKAGVKAKVVVGGAPVTQSFANEIGADGYAPDAASAVDRAKELLN